MLCDQNISHISRYFVTDNGLQLWTEVLSIIFVTSFNFNTLIKIADMIKMKNVPVSVETRASLGLTTSVWFGEQALHGFVVGRLARYTGIFDHLLCSGDADLTCF